MKKRKNETTGRNRRYHVAFLLDTNRNKATQVVDRTKKKAKKNSESDTQF